jgi:sugar lactone lactonase YvrE
MRLSTPPEDPHAPYLVGAAFAVLALTPAPALAQRVVTLTDTISAGSGGMEVDADGLIYMSDFGRTLQGPPGPNVYRVTPSGEVSVWAEGLVGASGNAFDSEGRFLQSNIGSGRLSRIAPDGTVEPWVSEGIQGPVGIAVAPGDTLFVASCGGHTIQRVTPDGASSLFSDSELLRCPNGITRAPDGTLYVANFGNGDVVALARDGSASVLATVPGDNNGHLVWHDRALYVVARGANQIYRLDTDGALTLLAGTGERGLDDGPALEATLSLPNDLAFSPDGRVLYFNDVAVTEGPHTVIAPVVVRALILGG